MREALARSDLDFTISEPKEKNRRPADATRFPRILRVASVSTACLVCAVIVVNALYLQDRKHPAPLLRAPDPAPASEPVAPAQPAAKPIAIPAVLPAPAAPAKNAGRDTIADEINRVAAPADRKAKPIAAAKEESHSDAIADLLGNSAPDASVLAAQKALVRLGYVLRADGVRGATTKQAIEHYERDNKLPVRGELTPKLARELAAKAGNLAH